MSQETNLSILMTKCDMEDANFEKAKAVEKEAESFYLIEQTKPIPKEMMEDGNKAMVRVICPTNDVFGDNQGAKETLELEKKEQNSDGRASDLDKKVGSSKKASEAASKNGKADAMKEVPEERKLKPGGWVRCRRGVYQGDLAYILRIKEDAKVCLKLVPRMKYDERHKGRNQSQKLDFLAIQKLGWKFSPRDDSLYELAGKLFSRDGYLHALMNFTDVIEADPSDLELQLFDDGGVNLKEFVESLARERAAAVIKIGNQVMVCGKGENKNVVGTLKDISETSATVIRDKGEHIYVAADRIQNYPQQCPPAPRPTTPIYDPSSPAREMRHLRDPIHSYVASKDGNDNGGCFGEKWIAKCDY